MSKQVRELLVTSKEAENWQDHFDEKVEELMELVNKVDTDLQVKCAGELIDVYKKTISNSFRLKVKKSEKSCFKPFEFLVFRN